MRVRNVLMAAVAGLALSSVSAMADTYTGPGNAIGTLNVVSPGGTGANVTGPGHSGVNVWAGEIVWNYASSPTGWLGLPVSSTGGGINDHFGTFCTQLNTNVLFGEKVKFVAVDLETLADLTTGGFGHDRKLAIQALFGTFKAGIDSMPVNNQVAIDAKNVAAEAFQAVIWEIIYDAPTGRNLNSGTFILNNGASDPIKIKAEYYLANMDYLSQQTVTGLKAYDYYSGAAVQNQSVLAVLPGADVPLPASATAGLALLALNGLWYWKRRRD